MRRLMVDLDETVVSCLKPWLDAYNAEYQDDLTHDDITEWDFGSVLKSECEDMFKYIRAPGFFRNLKPLPGAIEALRELHESRVDGKRVFDIVVCTAASHGNQAADKFDWFYQHLKFLGKRNLIVASRKELVDADVYIDDSPENHRNIRRERPNAEVLTIAYPYNQVTAGLVNLRAGDHEHTIEAWTSFVHHLRSH